MLRYSFLVSQLLEVFLYEGAYNEELRSGRYQCSVYYLLPISIPPIVFTKLVIRDPGGLDMNNVFIIGLKV